MEVTTTTMSPNIEVYYVVDLDTSVFDTYTITKCLHVFLQTTFRDHLFTRFQHVPLLPLTETNDVIKRGLQQFSFMFDTLKLKSSDTTWFIYISNGHVPVGQCGQCIGPVGVMLLNKNPSCKECLYTIHKTPFKVLKKDCREIRLHELKIFTKTFKELFSSNKTIKYNAVNGVLADSATVLAKTPEALAIKISDTKARVFLTPNHSSQSL